jgi:hypothetical protein
VGRGGGGLHHHEKKESQQQQQQQRISTLCSRADCAAEQKRRIRCRPIMLRTWGWVATGAGAWVAWVVAWVVAGVGAAVAALNRPQAHHQACLPLRRLQRYLFLVR